MVFPRRWLLFLALLFLVPGTVSAQKPPPIRLVAFDYPPFYFVNNNRIQGIAVELVQTVFSRIGRDFTLTSYPLNRALRLLQEGEADGIMILIKTPQRSKYLRFTDPVITVRGLLWYCPERQKTPLGIESLEDLKNFRIGITRGYSYGPAFDAMLGQTNNKEEANSDILNYRKLLHGRIDIFPGNEIVARDLFKRHRKLGEKLAHTGHSFIFWDLRMAVSRQSSAGSLVPEINEVIHTLRNDGEVDRIVNRYTQ